MKKTLWISAKWLAWGAAAVCLAAVPPSYAQQLSQAEALYQHTDYAGSLAMLDKNTNDPATNFLIGRNLFMQGELRKATEYLQKVLEEQPNNSEYVDWLGRLYGKRAE